MNVSASQGCTIIIIRDESSMHGVTLFHSLRVGFGKIHSTIAVCTCQPWHLYMQDNLTHFAGFCLLLQDNTAWLGLDGLFFFFYLLFYSFILESLTYYSFHSTYYSFYCSYYSHSSSNYRALHVVLAIIIKMYIRTLETTGPMTACGPHGKS